jgi:hypothetical protein
VALQLLILLTGNYGFFNLISLALCILLLDDACWPARWRSTPAVPGRGWPRLVLAPLAIFIVILGAMNFVWAFRMRVEWPAPLEYARALVEPLRSANGYGLFTHMTTQRPEIILEGSDDGQTWKPYEFKWKPGNPQTAPRLLVGHMPRLDWQMWFAALGGARNNPWLGLMARRLLEGSPPVLAQLGSNPFPEHPPRFIRALLYQYHFTDVAERHSGGVWWRRELKGIYAQPLSLEPRSAVE